MTRKNMHNEPIEREQYREHRLDTLRRGVYVLFDAVAGRVLGTVMLALLVLGWVMRESICALLAPGILGGLLLGFYPVLYTLVAAAAVVLFLVVLAQPWYYDRIARDLIRAGLVNKAGEPPVLRRRKTEDGTPCMVWTFRARGIPIGHWLDSQPEIESALNVNIVDVREGKDRQTILLITVSPNTALGENIMWDDGYLHEDEAIILLGRGLAGDITVNLDKVYHFLIGGGTGSGKSILLKVILHQALLRGHQVHVADFKGGVEFSRWQNCDVITEEYTLLALLEKVIAEIEARQQAFKRLGARNITEYRKLAGTTMPRIFIGCDEVAELLDKAGASKTRKELLDKIISAFSTVARLGRAFGVHLVLAMQRPDANVLTGQIKNNIDVRICGRADATLSGIVLGDGRAHERIPKYAQGRFVKEDGTLFQGFNFAD